MKGLQVKYCKEAELKELRRKHEVKVEQKTCKKMSKQCVRLMVYDSESQGRDLDDIVESKVNCMHEHLVTQDTQCYSRNWWNRNKRCA